MEIESRSERSLRKIKKEPRQGGRRARGNVRPKKLEMHLKKVFCLYARVPGKNISPTSGARNRRSENSRMQMYTRGVRARPGKRESAGRMGQKLRKKAGDMKCRGKSFFLFCSFAPSQPLLSSSRSIIRSNFLMASACVD